jgi:hypothetical protein
MLDLLINTRPEVVALTSAAAATTLDLAPPAGELWICSEVYGWHDDTGAARDSSWTLYDGTSAMNTSTLSLAAFLRWSAYAWIPAASQILCAMALPRVLHHTQYMRLNVAAVGAGKVIHIDAVVFKVKGIGEFK